MIYSVFLCIPPVKFCYLEINTEASVMKKLYFCSFRETEKAEGTKETCRLHKEMSKKQLPWVGWMVVGLVVFFSSE